MPQAAAAYFTFHVEHIRARQHGGTDDAENLALACPDCNAFKGPNLSAVDPETNKVVLLFNPRNDAWEDHFERLRARIVGRTEIGRATVALLNMNEDERLEMREALLARGNI